VRNTLGNIPMGKSDGRLHVALHEVINKLVTEYYSPLADFIVVAVDRIMRD